MTAQLRIAPQLQLPIDAVTETFAILAVKRAGKSNAAVVMAEEMYDAGVPWVAIDPKGDWWGVRAAGDGKAPGLSVLVFGGLHGDVPLEPTAGRLVADLVVEQRITCVLDVSEMTKADQRRFLVDFADRLYRRNTEPLHVFCEEADEYIPQRTVGENAKLVGTFETLVKRGGFRGIGITLITQRSASLNKDVLTQAGTLIAMRTPSPQDRKAVLAWIDYHAASRDVIDELPTLEAGEAWVFSPQWLKALTKIRFRRRRTFDSGATPKVGGKPRPPARLADVDLAAIKEAMADTIERAKAEDPRELRRRIAELERQAARPAPTHLEIVEVPVWTNDDRRALFAIAGELTTLHHAVTGLTAKADDLSTRVGTVLVTTQGAQFPAGAKEGKAGDRPTRSTQTPAAPPARRPGTPTTKSRPAEAHAAPRPAGAEDTRLGKAHKAVLSVLSRFPDGKSRKAIAALAGLKAGGGHFGNVLSALRTQGLITGEGQGPYVITDAGLAALGDDYTPLPEGQALLSWWLEQLGRAHRAVLTALVDHYPDSLDRAYLAQMVGLDPSGGHFGNVLSNLRTRDLITGKSELRVDDEFMAAIRA